MTATKKPDVLRLGLMKRSGEVVAVERDQDSRVRRLSVLSETPVERWFGIEILDHGADSVDLSRLNNAANLLMYHDQTRPVGVIERAWVDSETRRTLVDVRFGSFAQAEEAMQQVDEGILTHVSAQYAIRSLELEKEEKGKPPVYRAMNWQPNEVSLVTVAADDSVGYGRSADGDESPVEITRSEEMENQNLQAPADAAPAKVDVKAERQSATIDERTRVKAINEFTSVARRAIKNVDELASAAIAEGRSVEEFITNCRTLGEPISAASAAPATLDLGSKGQRELDKFNIMNAIRAFRSPGDQKALAAAARELEISRELEIQSGRAPQSFFVPLEYMARTLNVTTTTQGGFLVGTDHQGQSFIDVLRNRSQTIRAGATVLSGLRDKLSIPALAAGASGSWVAEGNAASETTHTIAQVSLDPKSVTAWSEVTDLLLKQSSPQVESMIMNDLVGALSTAMDYAGLHGTGSSDDPTGIASTSGIGAVVGGSTGLAPTWLHITKLEEEVAVDNADIGNLAYMTNPKVRRALKNTAVLASTDSRLVWQTGVGRPLNDYMCYVTNQVRSNISKGGTDNLSAIFFGNWADLVYGIWGGMDVLVDPYSQSTTGKVRIVARLACDVAVRRAVSFAAMLDASTA